MLEKLLERIVWGSRFIIVVPVIACLLLAVVAFLIGTADVIYVIGHVFDYLHLDQTESVHAALRANLIGTVIKSIDVYLLAAILIIVSLGFYELFIGKIEIAEDNAVAERLLLIRSIDDFKDRLAKVILLILVVEFLSFALGLHPNSMLDLLYLAGGIVLVGAAIYLASRH